MTTIASCTGELPIRGKTRQKKVVFDLWWLTSWLPTFWLVKGMRAAMHDNITAAFDDVAALSYFTVTVLFYAGLCRLFYRKFWHRVD